MIHDEIATWRVRSEQLGIDPDLACARFYRLLDEIYLEDLPLAKAKDNSDLLLHLEGRAVEGIPRLSLVSGVFNNVKVQVRDLTKAIAGILPERKITVQEIDLGLSGLAKGSLFIGFSAPLPHTDQKQLTLLDKDDPLYRATKDALRIINTLSHSIEFGEDSSARLEAAKSIDDPKIRDAALVAVRRIAPSGKSGISRIGVTSSNDRRGPAQLTPETRQRVGRMLAHPVSSKEVMQIEGTVREIDLDAKRFELRNIAHSRLADIRCVYAFVEDIQPRKLLDARVRVRGRVERRPDEMPRLMAVEQIDIVASPSDEQEELL